MDEKDSTRLFYRITCAAFSDARLSLPEKADYASLFRQAIGQGMTLLFCRGLGAMLPQKGQEAAELAKECQQERFAALASVLRGMENAGVDVLPLDGASLQAVYPDRFCRECRQISLLVRREDESRAGTVLTDAGFISQKTGRKTLYFKKPATRIVLCNEKNCYNGVFPLWEKARGVRGTQHIFTLRAEDRYLCALLRLRQRLESGDGGAVLLVDLLALRSRNDTSFREDYLTEQTEAFDLGNLSHRVTEAYYALVCGDSSAELDRPLIACLLRPAPETPQGKKNEEKRKLAHRVRIGLYIAAGVIVALALVLGLYFFGRSYLPGKSSSQTESDAQTESAEISTEFSQPTAVALTEGMYTGPLKDGKPDGYGKMEYYTGDTYVGMFSDGVREGEGSCVFILGGKFDGVYAGDVIAEGTLYFANGDKVKCTFKNGLPDGEGVYTYASGGQYTGTLVAGVRQGEGTYILANGDTYIGSFVNGMREGKGKYTYVSGAVYDGNWSNGVQSGQGTYTDVRGTYTGGFSEGKFEGEGVYRFANGDVYTGAFRGGKENDSEATLTYASGGKYTGAFVDGVFSGQGRIDYANGDIVTGTFVAGKLNGLSRYYYHAQGVWKNVTYENGEVTSVA